MATDPIKFKDAESCLRLTIRSMNLSHKDAEYLELAMRTYASIYAAEKIQDGKKWEAA